MTPPAVENDDHQQNSPLDRKTEAENHNNKQYKTPVIPKNMSKLIARKASTPRLEEEIPPAKETKEELVKKCFGFDTDSADSDTSIGNTTRDSLVGFSPVRSAQPNNHHLIITPAFTKTCDKTKV